MGISKISDIFKKKHFGLKLLDGINKNRKTIAGIFHNKYGLLVCYFFSLFFVNNLLVVFVKFCPDNLFQFLCFRKI